ncbi:diguanylate cyclase [Candidatus Woesearchaeota archaeon]|nr:diguanylate cyclase [Candidatus Woesearchaeota archaeon]
MASEPVPQLYDIACELDSRIQSYEVFRNDLLAAHQQMVAMQAKVEQSLTDILKFGQSTVGIEPPARRDMINNVLFAVDTQMRTEYAIPALEIPSAEEYIGSRKRCLGLTEEYSARSESLKRSVERLDRQKERMVISLMKERDICWRTGLYNPRLAEPLVAQEIRNVYACQDGGRPALSSLIFIDFDKFGRFNKLYGSIATNEVLALIGHTLLSNLGPDDKGIRYGGDELLVLLPGRRGDSEYSEAMEQALAIQSAIYNLNLEDIDPGMHFEKLTFSAGIVQFRPRDSQRDFMAEAREWISEADQISRQAKKDGGNLILACGRVEEPENLEHAVQHHPLTGPAVLQNIFIR